MRPLGCRATFVRERKKQAEPGYAASEKEGRQLGCRLTPDATSALAVQKKAEPRGPDLENSWTGQPYNYTWMTREAGAAVSFTSSAG